MKKYLAVFAATTALVLIYVLFISYSNNMNYVFVTGYAGKLGEIVNYHDHPTIIIDSISIRYLGSTPRMPATEKRAALSSIDQFDVAAGNGKSFQINWSSGAGELYPPSYFITENGCYELHINVIVEGAHIESIQERLVLKRTTNDKCNDQVHDLR